MNTVTTRLQLQASLQQLRNEGKSIGLVPTMGNLHDGHLALVNAAIEHCDVTVVSIFVNPLQFGPGEDLAAYPRTLEKDIAVLEEAKCDILFVPDASEIYEDGLERHTRVSVPGLTSEFCGASRPGHFDGVTTVVAKLFNLVQPHTAYFGLKDYQQFLVIRKMTVDLAMDIELVGIETVREESGLALSSRNSYLNKEEKELATRLYHVLQLTVDAIDNGDRDYSRLEQSAAQQLGGSRILLDYFAIRDARNLQAPKAGSEELVILGAIRIGASRLIDNVRIRLAS